MHLLAGKGLAAENLELLAKVGGHIERQGEEELFVVGADFNANPEQIRQSGFAAKVGGVIVATENPRGTCRTPHGCSLIDFFVISSGLEGTIDSIIVDGDLGAKTHVPSVITSKPSCVSLKGLVMRKPPLLPTDRLIGPVRTMSWEVARTLAELAAEMAMDGDRVQAGKVLEEAYRAWAAVAEAELMEITGEMPIKAGLRGEEARFAWRPVVLEKKKGVGKEAQSWVWHKVLGAVADGKMAREATATISERERANEEGWDAWAEILGAAQGALREARGNPKGAECLGNSVALCETSLNGRRT